ncbi:MAG: DUF3084 domain-containing protein [Potamolinea sp.]
MTSGYILIVAVLVLGGLLATLGDRIGTKVGKARLSLFKLRPRNTATVVTIITGSLISASTLGLLFATSLPLRQGVFELDDIQKKRRVALGEIEKINAQKSQIEKELTKTRAEQADVQNRLDITNQNFQQAQSQLKDVSQQANILRQETKSLLTERQDLRNQRQQLSEQITQLREEISKQGQVIADGKSRLNELETERQGLIQERQKLSSQITQLKEEFKIAIAQREMRFQGREQELKGEIVDREIRLREREQELTKAIAQRETRLQELERELTQRENQIADRDKQITEKGQQITEKGQQITDKEKQLADKDKQLAFVQKQVESLEQYYQDYQALREGRVVLVRGRVLAFGVVRIVEPKAATDAVDQLLREANRTAIEFTRSNKKDLNEPLVQIPQTQVEQLINQIKDGKDYVVRILSAGNYVEGEKQVRVFADAALNQVVFQAGDILATIPADASSMNNEEIRQRLEQLLAAAQFRARRAGILGGVQVGDGRITTIISFIEQLEKYKQPVEVKVVAEETTSTAGPLKMQLVAIQNGQVIFKS